jgi:hypothetical protein
MAGAWEIELDSGLARVGDPFDGRLDGDEAVVLRPRPQA